MLDLIAKKRDAGEHTREELERIVAAAVDDGAPDYQLASWLMAVVCRGMTQREMAHFTLAMAHSGRVLDLSDLPGPVADKHSTGGVGDKTTLVAAPLAAATGLIVAKMSGRGLGHTGGTLDKLEAVPGLRVSMSADRFRDQASEVGLVIAGQSAELAPADGRLYALRSVTGTVPSEPLIAASIMSKKIAGGARALALDVKVGAGAFMRDHRSARSLASAMLVIAKNAGIRCNAALSAMDQPLGSAVGNALEVREAVTTLQGAGPPDLLDLSLTMAGLMHVAAGLAGSVDAARPTLQRALDSGAGLEAFARMIAAQGGDARITEDPDRLPQAPHVRDLASPANGFVSSIDPLAVGNAVLHLGAGRTRKDQPVDPAVGVELLAKVGEAVEHGQPLARFHAREEGAAIAAERWVLGGIAIDAARPSSAVAAGPVIEILTS